MILIARPIRNQSLALIALFGVLSCLVTWLLQAMRLGQFLVSVFSEPRAAISLIGYSAPTVLASTLPFALLTSIAFVCAKLHASGEIEAMRAIGAKPHFVLTLGLTPAVLIVALTSAVLTASVEPVALSSLRHRLEMSSAKSILSRIAPGQLSNLAPGLTLFVGERGNHLRGSLQLNRVFLASGDPPRILVARHGAAQVVADGADLILREGELQLPATGGAPLYIRFGRLRYRLPLTQWFERHLGFLSRITSAARPFDLAALCLACSLAAGICFTRYTPRQAFLATAALIVGVEVGARLITALIPGHPTRLYLTAALIPVGYLLANGVPRRFHGTSSPNTRA